MRRAQDVAMRCRTSPAPATTGHLVGGAASVRSEHRGSGSRAGAVHDVMAGCPPSVPIVGRPVSSRTVTALVPGRAMRPSDPRATTAGPRPVGHRGDARCLAIEPLTDGQRRLSTALETDGSGADAGCDSWLSVLPDGRRATHETASRSRQPVPQNRLIRAADPRQRRWGAVSGRSSRSRTGWGSNVDSLRSAVAVQPRRSQKQRARALPSTTRSHASEEPWPVRCAATWSCAGAGNRAPRQDRRRPAGRHPPVVRPRATLQRRAGIVGRCSPPARWASARRPG